MPSRSNHIPKAFNKTFLGYCNCNSSYEGMRYKGLLYLTDYAYARAVSSWGCDVCGYVKWYYKSIEGYEFQMLYERRKKDEELRSDPNGNSFSSHD